MVRYKTILKRAISEFEEKKSTFIGYVSPCKTEEEALDFIDEINKKHHDATHNCTAYIIGENAFIQRYDDDGEPQGTAGIPILEVLKKENLTNICCVVTRYFGGTLLGASGLIRAYTKGASDSIEESLIVEMKDYYKVNISLDYTYIGKFDNWLNLSDNVEIDRTYSDKVEVKIYVDVDEYEDMEKELLDMTSANISIDIYEELLVPTKDNKAIIGGSL